MKVGDSSYGSGEKQLEMKENRTAHESVLELELCVCVGTDTAQECHTVSAVCRLLDWSFA